MRAGTITTMIMSAGLSLFILAIATAGCPQQAPPDDTTPAAQSSTDTPSAAREPAAAPDTPDQPQASSRKVLTPPYLTISGIELPEEVKLMPGQMVTAYWELPEPLAATAWLGLVPVSVPAENQASRAAALTAEELAGRTKAMLSFAVREPGVYVWRMFTGDSPDEKPYLESESFEVSAAPPTAESTR